MNLRGAVALAFCTAALLHCGGEKPLEGVFLYSPSAEARAGRIAAFRIDQKRGNLERVATESPSAGPFCVGAVVHPSRPLLYLKCMDVIAQFRIADDGSLEDLGPLERTIGRPPGRNLAIHPDGRSLYLAGSDQIFQLDIDPKKGTLRGKTAVLALDIEDLYLEPGGKFLYVADRTDTWLRKHVVDAGSGSVPMENTPMRIAAGGVRNVVFHPSGKYAFVLSVNRSKEASVSSYTVGSDGEIGHIKTAAIGGTTDCMAVDPRGEFLYVCSSAFPETAVSTFRIDSRGSLAEVRASPRVMTQAPEMLVPDPAGNFLYAGTRTDQLYGFYVERSTGALSPITGFPVTTSGRAMAMVVTPQVGTAPPPVVAVAEEVPVRKTPRTPQRMPSRFVTAPPGAPAHIRLRDPNAYVRTVAVHELRRTGGLANAIPQLLEMLDDPEDGLAIQAAVALGDLGPAYAHITVPALLRAASYGRLPVRQVAAQQLPKTGDQSPAVMAAIRSVEQDTYRRVSPKPAPPLPRVPESNLEVQTLVERLGTGARDERNLAATQLMGMGALVAPATRRLIELIHSPDPFVRRTAVELLGNIGPRAGEAIPELYGVLRESGVGDAAAIAIVKIRGEGPREIDL